MIEADNLNDNEESKGSIRKRAGLSILICVTYLPDRLSRPTQSIQALGNQKRVLESNRDIAQNPQKIIQESIGYIINARK